MKVNKIFFSLFYGSYLEEDELIRNQFTMALYQYINNMDIEVRDTPV